MRCVCYCFTFEDKDEYEYKILSKYFVYVRASIILAQKMRQLLSFND